MSHYGFLMWLRNHYNSWEIQQTYHQIAAENGALNYGSVRTYLLKLIEAGYITVENQGKHNQTYTIDQDKFEELING